MIGENRLKKGLNGGKTLLGSLVTTPAPAYVEAMGKLGYDFVFIDTEHGYFSVEDSLPLVMVADIWGVTPLIRVVENRRDLISKALDLGAQGVIIPHVHSKEELRRAVESAYYPPRGSRGASPSVRSAGYAEFEWAGFQERSNENVMVIPLIEDRRGIENLDEMMDTDEVELYCLGPFDYSVDIGVPGDRVSPKVEKVMENAVEKIVSSGRHAMYPVLDVDEAKKWHEKGVKVFVYGIDTIIYSLSLREFAEKVRKLD